MIGVRRPPRWGWCRVVAAVLLALAVGVGGPAAPVAGLPSPRTYRPPTTAPVADPFRPPPEPWLAGNRGIEYRTEPGAAVGAIGPGTISFAGSVAGQRIVTVTHPDGLRSSYVDLAVVLVVRGERVAAGQLVGRATDRLHLGVRRGEAYLDPASLWGTEVGGGRVVLVPTEADGRGPGGGGGADRTVPPTGPPVPPPAAPPTRDGGGADRALTPADLAGPALALVVARSLAPP